MRRPNRSIEVFDISLMAVVTKAMGAFLVLMLLLMPYYSSGPVGEKNAADLAKAVAEAEATVRALSERLSQVRDPAELAKLLEEARRKLEEAQRLITLLKRDNDALNSQAQRLRDQVAALEAGAEQLQAVNADLQRQLHGAALVGQITNWDCLDVRMEVGLLSLATVFTKKQGDQAKYVLSQISSLGDTVTVTEDEIVAEMPEQRSNPPGRGARFNQSTFRYSGRPGSYFIVVVNRSKTAKKIDGYDVYPLKRASKDCRVMLSTMYYLPKTKSYGSYFVREATIAKTEYATIVRQVLVKEDAVDTQQISAEAVAWLKDQVDRAEKEITPEPEASTPRPAADKERQRERQQQLERMGKSPVDVGTK
jgi:hypothetical protein